MLPEWWGWWVQGRRLDERFAQPSWFRVLGKVTKVGPSPRTGPHVGRWWVFERFVGTVSRRGPPFMSRSSLLSMTLIAAAPPE